MLARDFCFWAQGFFELASAGQEGDVALTAEQVKVFRKHLELAFLHDIDPSMPQPAPKTAHQQKLDIAHGGKKQTGAELANEHGFVPHQGGLDNSIMRC